ncbi:MAG: T9SS type A sorting domain-containing protein, partial [Bacteroidota bacterium]
TGNNLPDNQWGYGKVNGYGAVKGCTVGIDELSGYENIDFGIRPNPIENSSMIYFDFSRVTDFTKATVCLRDMAGRKLLTEHLQDDTGTTNIYTKELSSGIYLLSLEIDGRVVKIVKAIVQ